MQSIIKKSFILVNETEIRFFQFCNSKYICCMCISVSKYTYSQISLENSGRRGKWNHPWNDDNVNKVDKRLEKKIKQTRKNLLG